MMVNVLHRLSVALAAVVLTSSFAWAGKPVQPAAKAVDLFQAVEAGELEAQIIFKNSKQATVLLKNKADRPLHIRLPEAFAGVPVPVLAQFGGGGRGGGGGGLGGGGGGNQGGGGGLGGGGGGGRGGGGGGGGFFNVGVDKVGKIKVAVVCLEHGKKDPNPRVRYEMRPIETFTDKAEVIELCKMLGRGEVDQTAAQAAAWHLTDGLTWQQLAAKEGARHLNGTVEPYFTADVLRRAVRIAAVAVQRGRENPLPSPGETARN